MLNKQPEDYFLFSFNIFFNSKLMSFSLCFLLPSFSFRGHTHLIVQEDAHYRRHHTENVCEGDWVAQHEQWDANDHDPLGGIGDSVAERTDEVKYTEGDDILSEVAEATDKQEDKGARPSWDIQL